MTESLPPAGWYSFSPENPGRLRYWDGKQWTEQYQDAASSGHAERPAPSQPNPSVQPDVYVNQYAQNPVAEPVKDKSSLAIASLILGIIGPFAAIIAIFGYACGILALVFGVKSLKSSKRGFAIAGIILGTIALIAAIVNSALGVMMAMTSGLF